MPEHECMPPCQGVVTGNPFWDFISGLLKDPTPEQVECHAPKPILLDTGEIQYPYAWHPTQVDTQIIRLGQVSRRIVQRRCVPERSVPE